MKLNKINYFNLAFRKIKKRLTILVQLFTIVKGWISNWYLLVIRSKLYPPIGSAALNQLQLETVKPHTLKGTMKIIF